MKRTAPTRMCRPDDARLLVREQDRSAIRGGHPDGQTAGGEGLGEYRSRLLADILEASAGISKQEWRLFILHLRLEL